MAKKNSNSGNSTSDTNLVSSRASRRSRRSPEELLFELEERRQRLEKQLYKRNQEAIFTIGTYILKAAQFDVSTFTDELTDRIKNDPEYAHKFIQSILVAACENEQL